MANCLITGGAGFIGSHLAQYLVARGDRVTIIDDFSTGSEANLERVRGAVKLYEGTVQKFPDLRDLVAASDVVYHLAATVGVLNVITDPVQSIQNNIDGTEVVLSAAAVTSRCRVIVASTSEVYGKSAVVPFREEDDLLFGPSSKSRWAYATSKLVDEFLALAYWRKDRVPATVVRLFNTIGPRQVGRYGMVVPRFVAQALDDQDLTVHGDGLQTRCFVHVSDVVEWMVRLAVSDKAVGEVVNLGNPEEISIRDLARLVISLTDSRSGLAFVPVSEVYGPGFEDVNRRVPAIDKVIALTGCSPQLNLHQALTSIIEWFRTAEGERARLALSQAV